jgi:hypothetical protein
MDCVQGHGGSLLLESSRGNNSDVVILAYYFDHGVNTRPTTDVLGLDHRAFLMGGLLSDRPCAGSWGITFA